MVADHQGGRHQGGIDLKWATQGIRIIVRSPVRRVDDLDASVIEMLYIVRCQRGAASEHYAGGHLSRKPRGSSQCCRERMRIAVS